MSQSYASALESALRLSANLNATCTSLRDRAAAESVTVLAITQIYERLQDAKDEIFPLIALDTSQGGSADLQAIANNNLIDPPADILAMWGGAFTAGAAVQAEIENMVPIPANAPANDPMLWTDPNTGRVVYRTFTTVETATLRTLLDDVIAALV